MTTEVKGSLMEKPRSNIMNWMSQQPPEEAIKLFLRGPAHITKRIGNREPGSRLQDVALHEAAGKSLFEIPQMAREAMSVEPADFNTGPWQGSPLEASQMVETAGIFPEGGQIFPAKYRYVITGTTLVPFSSGMRTPSVLGIAADRVGFEHA
ncbi:MAG: hypothetical protein GY866_28505 [Proteobacteria bacterium]|nr:hypothetical protein [Pseudomonadota bacterium]